MAQLATARQPSAHPVVLLARALGVLCGLLALMAHAPLVWAAVAGLTAYAATLWAFRGRWPSGTRTQ